MHLFRVLPCLILSTPLVAQQVATAIPQSTYVEAHPILQQVPHDRASSSLIMEEMPLVAPLFIEDHNTSSALVLANNSSENAGATITVRNLRGMEVGQRHIVLKPHEDLHLAISSFAANLGGMSQYGSISVLPDSDLKGPSIAGQLLITDHSNSVPAYLDEELAMPDMQGSSILRSVTDDAQGQPLLAVTNLATQLQKVTVRCLGSDSAQKETTLSIEPHATSLTSACSGSFVADISHFLSQPADTTHKGVVGIEIVGDGGSGELAAFAIAPHLHNVDTIFSSVPFTDPALTHSADMVFAGVPLGPQPTLPNGLYIPRLSLSNFASTPAHVTVTLNVTARSRMESSDGDSSVRQPQIISSLTIPPNQSREVVFKGTESQSGLLNSIYVASDKQPGDVQGKVVSRSDGSLYEIELLGKDVRDLNNGGIHPWTSENDAESHLILYNHSKGQKKFDVAVFNGQMLWDKTYYLDASETLEISFNELMHDKVKDNRHQILDPSLTHGVVNWSTPDGGDATGRLMVTSRNSVMARNFSCGNFVIPCGGYFQQVLNFIGVGQAAGLYGLYPNYCNSYNPGQCSGNQQGSGSANFSNTTSAPSIIAFNNSSQVTSSNPTMKGMAAGSSNFQETAQANGCTVQGSGSATVQVPKYFFSPSETNTTLPAACSQQNATGFFIDVSYYVADASSTRISQAGMSPGENLGDGVWHDSFATPTTTRSDGSFDDVPRGACYSVSTHFCAAGSPQSFRVTSSGVVSSIATNTTSRECTDGIKLVIQGNPTAQNKTYTVGNTQ